MSENAIKDLIAADETAPADDLLQDAAAAEHQANDTRSRASERIQELIAQRDEERRQREALEARLSAAEKLREEVELLRDTLRTPSAPEPEAPAFMEDPQGHIDARMVAMQKKLQELEDKATSGSQQALQQAENAKAQLVQMQFVSRIQGEEASFQRDHPDYMDALRHLREVRVQEMKLLGVANDDIAKAINAEEMNAAMAAIARGKNPAEFVYSRAKLQGYQPRGTPQKGADGEMGEEQDDMAILRRRELAGSLGSSGGDNVGASTPQDEMWAPIERAFKELYGVSLK